MKQPKPLKVLMQDGTTYVVPITPFVQMKAEDKAQEENWAGGFQSLRATMYGVYYALRHSGRVRTPFEKWAEQVAAITTADNDTDTDDDADDTDDDPKS